MRFLAAALGLALWGSGLAAEPALLTGDQMRVFGIEALNHGFADQALAVAEALLQRDPKDVLALIMKAQALRMRGEYAASEAAARAAWAVADTDAQRYSAATALAQALSLQNHHTPAQYWLRQAVQNAPNPGARAQAVQDFAYVRDQNPVSLQFDASVRPSNNVNGGARDPLFVIHGIPFILSGDALALSGLAYGAGVSGTYRLGDDGRVRTDLTFAASHQGVVLSQEAQLQAPDARNGDYALSSLEIGWQRKAKGNLGEWTTELSAGHTWYGGADLSDTLTAGISLDRALSEKVDGSFGINMTQQTRIGAPVSSSNDVGIDSTLSTSGPRGDHWQIALNLSRVTSQDISTDHREAALTLGWQAAKPVAGLGLGASLSAKVADYDLSPYTPNGRLDRRIAASINVTLQEMTYLGFSPVLTLDLARNVSNVAIYDTESAGISLSVKSRF